MRQVTLNVSFDLSQWLHDTHLEELDEPSLIQLWMDWRPMCEEAYLPSDSCPHEPRREA